MENVQRKEHPGLWCECGLGEVTSKIQRDFSPPYPLLIDQDKKVSETYDALFRSLGQDYSSYRHWHRQNGHRSVYETRDAPHKRYPESDAKIWLNGFVSYY